MEEKEEGKKKEEGRTVWLERMENEKNQCHPKRGGGGMADEVKSGERKGGKNRRTKFPGQQRSPSSQRLLKDYQDGATTFCT